MIVQCADCKARYELQAAKVPARTIRVRCPRCRAVFSVDGTQAAVQPSRPAQRVAQAASPAAASGPVPSAPLGTPHSGELHIEHHRAGAPQAAPSAAASDEPPMDFEIERSAAPAAGMTRPAPNAPAGAAAGGTAVMDKPAAGKPAADPAKDKSRRLARALVSDILIYHRDARDRALAEGTLVQTLGQEIKKSWELYKERVTPEVANSSNHFREALNEILADGQQIF